MAYQGSVLGEVQRGVDEESSDCCYIPGSTWHGAAWGSRADPDDHLGIDLGGSFSSAAL
jgi:hypothetical protein